MSEVFGAKIFYYLIGYGGLALMCDLIKNLPPKVLSTTPNLREINNFRYVCLLL